MANLMNLLNFFKNTFFSSKKKTILGFDIGSHTIKCAEITRDNGRIVLTGFTRARTFENTIINQIINDTHLLRANIKNLISNFRPDTNKVFISIPYEISIYGNFTIRNPEAIQDIEKQINDEIPYNIEDVYYSYFIFPEKGNLIVYYLVSKKENIDKLVDIFQSINLVVENIDADFINLHNFFEFLYGPENRLIIDWGNEKIKLHFSNKDVPVYTRELFNLGLRNISAELQRELKIASDLSEKLLVNPPNDNRREILKKILKKYINRLSEEIRFGFEIARSKYDLNPEKIYIIGGGARIPKIEEILRKLTGFEIRVADIRGKIEISKNIDPQYMEIINKQGIIAIATAVKEFI